MTTQTASAPRAPRAPRAVLWDLDGTLLDSNRLHWLAWQEIMAAEGHPLTYEQFASTFGQRNDKFLGDWLGPAAPQSEISRVAEAKEARYRQLIQTLGVELLPGVETWLERLAASGWRQALATSAPRANVEVTLQALGIGHYFDAIVAAEDVPHGKPDPRVFLFAARRLAAPAACCIVVEDSPAGIEGARRARMRSIGVSAASLPATLAVPTLDALPEDAFERLLAA